MDGSAPCSISKMALPLAYLSSQCTQKTDLSLPVESERISKEFHSTHEKDFSFLNRKRDYWENRPFSQKRTNRKMDMKLYQRASKNTR